MSARSAGCLLVVIALGAVLAAGCARPGYLGGDEGPDLTVVRAFDRTPLYWVGRQFEDWKLQHVSMRGDFVSFVYGTCEVGHGTDAGGCAPPLAIQIQPLCAHLDVVARAPIWRRRQVRGAPLGSIDSAPVLFTNRVQVKVYRGQGSDPGLPMRALRALRSANAVPPVVDPGDPIPAASLAVLDGSAPCRDGRTSAPARGPGALELGRFVCGPGIVRRVCAGPVTIDRRYQYVLRTHCGIVTAYFGGRLWRADPPLSDGAGNPPRGWENPEALGTMRLVRPGVAEFRARDETHVARFRPARRGFRPPICD